MFLYEVLLENDRTDEDYYSENTLIVAESGEQAEIIASNRYPAYDIFTATLVEEVDGYDIKLIKR